MYSSILLDAGGVILDETLYEKETKELIISVLDKVIGNYTAEDYVSDLDESIKAFSPHNRQYIFWKHSDNNIERYNRLWKQFKTEWDGKNHELKIMSGIKTEIISLSQRYNVILAGQYGKDIINILIKEDLLSYFTNKLSQDDFKITKPDPRYFEQICSSAGVKAEECIMVGDRIDKDIVPAKQNGMATVFIRSGVYKNQTARTPDEMPDLTLDSVIGLAESIEKKF